MNICLKCKLEMKCRKTGVIAVYTGSHCYAGDAFVCPGCESLVLVTSPNPFHDPTALDRGGINMDNWYKVAPEELAKHGIEFVDGKYYDENGTLHAETVGKILRGELPDDDETETEND